MSATFIILLQTATHVDFRESQVTMRRRCA
jgi:hypothetical protein